MSNVLHIEPDFQRYIPSDRDVFTSLMSIQGEVVREMNGRRTAHFERAGLEYFIKAHFGVGWREIAKNLLYLRLPVVGAGNEWRAIQHLERLGIDTTPLVAYGQQGWNPAKLKSFVITRALTNTETLAVYCDEWGKQGAKYGAELRFKRALIAKVARIAMTMHGNGMNHRDFYLCHFRLDLRSSPNELLYQEPRLHIMDLHRMQIRSVVPMRWLIKDLASLYFSCLEIGLTRTDVARFISVYWPGSLRSNLKQNSDMIRAIHKRALRLYRRFYGRDGKLPW